MKMNVNNVQHRPYYSTLCAVYRYIPGVQKKSRSSRHKDEVPKFRLSSRPQTGICWPPVSGPRTVFSFFVRFHRGSQFLACAGPILARALLGLRAAAEHGDPELRSFAGYCGDGETYRDSIFLFAPGDSFFSCCCDFGWSLSFIIFSISRARGRYRFVSTTPLRGSLWPSSNPSALPARVPDLPVALWDTRATLYKQQHSIYIYFKKSAFLFFKFGI